MNKKYQQAINILKIELQLALNEIAKNVIMEEPLKTKLIDLLNAPSKHIRTVISFLVLKALGYEINKSQIVLQSAIELVHNASLIHDDIIDESENRRNLKTLNSHFGNKLAVIAGDYLISLALKKIRSLGSFEIIEMFAQTLDDMCQGEVTQQFSKYKIPTIEEYIKKTEQKTAKLFETAVCGGLYLAKAKDIEQTRFSNFAKNFGIAFQIRDDLINAKTSKSDFKDGIYTAPVIFAGKVDEFENGIEKTQDLLNNYIECAQKDIENLQENEYKTALIELLGLIKNA